MNELRISGHYLGQKGRGYFAYQNHGGLRRGRINARKFARFVQPTDIVLDFGCGSGALLLHLDCKRRLGVEVNPVAREEAAKAGLEVHANLEAVADRSVTVALSNHVLEHVPCPLQTLVDLRHKLARDGRLILCVPIDDWRTQKRADPSDINHHLHTWTPLLMGNLLAEAGYEVEDVWVWSHAWPPYVWRQLDLWLPVWLFDVVCRVTAWLYKRRQIIAVARNI